jgi:ABC-type antimicrobial peptide transport system permease subunit
MEGRPQEAVKLFGSLVATVAMSRFIAALLYEVAPSDPLSLTAATGILALVAMLACAVPALRAARVAPAEALRTD